jgi:hypothetical protein
MGLGFGRPYTFYTPLSNLSFWPFWHYETHDAVLWLWMDGGLPTFFAFWWVMGAGLYWGGQELSRRREDWTEARAQLVIAPADGTDVGMRAAQPGRRSAGPRAMATSATERWETLARGAARPARATGAPRPTASEATADDTVESAAPSRTASRTASRAPSLKLVMRKLMRQGLPRFDGAQGAALALVVAGVCQIVMQVAYSYVDLGLISGRDMLLVGVLLGVVGRTFTAAPARRARRSATPAAQTVGATRGGARAATSPVEVVGTAARRATAGPRRGTGAPTRGTGAPTQRMDVDPHAYPSRERDRAGPIYSRSGH